MKNYTASNFRLACQADTIDLELRWKRGHMAHDAKAEIEQMAHLAKMRVITLSQVYARRLGH